MIGDSHLSLDRAVARDERDIVFALEFTFNRSIGRVRAEYSGIDMTTDSTICRRERGVLSR